MKVIIALEEMIKDNENVIKSIKKQLANHESGESKLSMMGLASCETNLENAQIQLDRHREKLKDLMAQDMSELQEKEKLREAIERKNYINYQKVRVKREVTRTNDEKIEAMLILDELDQDTFIEDKDLFAIAEKSLSMHLTVHIDLEKKFNEIKLDFEKGIQELNEEDLADLSSLNFRVILSILHVHVLFTNIQENIAEDNLPAFRGFPKFEDWWIVELWSNHHAYYALFKWKAIITKQCITDDQKRAWEIVFSNWIALKKVLSGKNEHGYHYNYVFDTVMRKYSELEEELATTSLKSMADLTQKIISKEDFSIVPASQKIITNYVLFKREQLDYKDVKEAPKPVEIPVIKKEE